MPSFSRHAAAISVILSFSTLASSPAETLLINAEVYGHPQADSIAIAQGKIIAIGKQQQLQRFIDAQTEKSTCIRLMSCPALSTIIIMCLKRPLK